MNNRILVCSFISGVLLSAVATHAEDKKDVIIKRVEKTPHIIIDKKGAGGPIEMELVTFLGVETVPVGRTLTVQLGLPADIGLVVQRVMKGSPADSVLQEHDILTKLDDQLLVDPRQLSVLVRSHREGDEVKLTVFRGGKEQQFKTKLGKREMPKMAGPQPMPWPPGGPPGMPFFNEEGPGPGTMWTQKLPGMGPEDVNKVMRMIGRERSNWFGAPPVHFFTRDGEAGSTILNLAKGNFVFSDEAGSVEVQAAEGNRVIIVKNPRGEITFEGPINDEEQRGKLPPEVVERLQQIENVDLDCEAGEDFEQEAVVEPPAKTKISQPLAPKKPRRPLAPSF